MRYGEPYENLDSFHPFGCRTLFWKEEDQHRKFDETAAEDVPLGYVDSGYMVLDMDQYVSSEGRILRVNKTRDVKL